MDSCDKSRGPVGLFIYREDDLFMRALTDHIQNDAEGTFELETLYGLNSQAIQNEQIETLMERGSPLMIINPVDRLGAHALLNKLKKADIPIIFFNREPLEKDIALWDKAWYVGARAEQSGRMQAELAMALFGANPESLNEYDRNSDGMIQTVILKGEQGHQDAEIRTESVQAAFRDNGYRLEVLTTEIANWNRNEAYEKMGTILDGLEGPPELVLCNNDAMALGAISIMRQRGLFHDENGNGFVEKTDSDWVPVLGIDGVPDAVGHIQEGFLYGTVLNDAKAMSEAIVELSQDLMSDGFDHPPSVEDRYIWVDYRTFILE